MDNSDIYEKIPNKFFFLFLIDFEEIKKWKNKFRYLIHAVGFLGSLAGVGLDDLAIQHMYINTR